MDPASSSRPSSGPPRSSELAKLLDQLRTANQHFSAARQHLDAMYESQDADHPSDQEIEAELRTAERELEAINARIRNLLKRP